MMDALLEWWRVLFFDVWTLAIALIPGLLPCYFVYTLLFMSDKPLKKWIPIYFALSIFFVMINPHFTYGYSLNFFGAPVVISLIWLGQYLFYHYHIVTKYGPQEDGLRMVFFRQEKLKPAQEQIVVPDEPIPLDVDDSGETVQVLNGAEIYDTKWSAKYDDDAIDFDEQEDPSVNPSDTDEVKREGWSDKYDHDALAFDSEDDCPERQADYTDHSAGWAGKTWTPPPDDDGIIFDDKP